MGTGNEKLPQVFDRSVGAFTEWRQNRDRALSLNSLRHSLRPGIVLALVVTSVVGGAGIIQWDRRLVVIGLCAGLVIVALNVVGVAIRHWHHRNTRLDAAYADAEVVVRMRSPRRLRSPRQLDRPGRRSS